MSLVLFCVAGALIGSGFVAVERGWPPRVPLCVVLAVYVGTAYLVIAAACWTAGGAFRYVAAGPAAFGILVLYLGWLHWRRHRPGRKRARKLIGEKSRQIRAALVRTMRRRAKPRPVLRPGRVPA